MKRRLDRLLFAIILMWELRACPVIDTMERPTSGVWTFDGTVMVCKIEKCLNNKADCCIIWLIYMEDTCEHLRLIMLTKLC